MTQRASWVTIHPAKGFTIVELLIVVVVIAILAAITIVSYNGVTAQAHDATVKSDLKTMMTKLELWKVRNGGYPNPSVEATNNLQDVGLQVTPGSYAVAPTTVNNVVYCYDNTDRERTYAVAALSKSGNAYYISGKHTSVQDFTSEWGEAAGEDAAICASFGDNLLNAFRGYAANDAGGNVWRAWTGVSN